MSRSEIAKCPGFSRLLLLSWDNTVQRSSKILKLWLESLNHEQNSVSSTICCPSLLRATIKIRKEGWAAAQFCAWGVALQDDHTEHAQKATLEIGTYEFPCDSAGNAVKLINAKSVHHDNYIMCHMKKL